MLMTMLTESRLTMMAVMMLNESGDRTHADDSDKGNDINGHGIDENDDPDADGVGDINMTMNDQSDDADGVCVCVCASHVPVGTHGLICTLALHGSCVEPKMQPGAANTLVHFALGLMPKVVPEHMLMGAVFYAALLAVHGHRPAIKELVDRLQPVTN